MKITVASGKGGTGKTTVAVSLALMASEQASMVGAGPVTLLDCDVEEPNAHLFLKPHFSASREVGVLTPVVDAARCTLCQRCAEVCAYHAIAVLKDQVLIFDELCHGCGSCSWNCAEGAISERLRPTGVVEAGHAAALGFVRGTLNVGEAIAVPVIREVKREGETLAPGGTKILDAPPGTSCPVVECLRGADYALLVTEPTPFGLHDLRIAVDVARGELGVPVGVVVNRDGVGDSGVDDYCRNEGISILLRIPLDRQIASACSDGIPLIEALPQYRQAFLGLLNRIRQEVQQ